MDAIFSAVADVLQLIVQPCYALTGNWWISILLFTLITKVVLLPMSLWVQKNSIVMVNVMPEINRIKVKYYGDREAIGEKQQAVFKEKHYHPLLNMSRTLSRGNEGPSQENLSRLGPFYHHPMISSDRLCHQTDARIRSLIFAG